MTVWSRPMDLSEGSRLVLTGEEWEVTGLQPHLGKVRLRRDDGQELTTTVRVLVNHPDFRPSTTTTALPAISRGRQPVGLDDLTDRQRDLVGMRYAHLMEAETGFRSGDRLCARPGEPRPGYDPQTTTLTQRRESKVAELRALPAEEARMLGLEHVSVRSLIRWAVNTRRFGIAGCISGNWLRPTGHRRSITPEIREAAFAVRAETLYRSRVSMKTRETLIHQYIRETFGPETPVPSYATLRRVWQEWFGAGGTRQRYARTAARLNRTGEHVVVHGRARWSRWTPPRWRCWSGRTCSASRRRRI